MRHEWLTTAATISKSQYRVCLNCKVEQSRYDHYDRLIGTTYQWTPRVGRCTGTMEEKKKDSRGSNRPKGSPGLPGAGRPPRSTRLHVGDSIAIKYAKDGGSTAFELGQVQAIRRGMPRTIVIVMRDGSTVYLLAETPKPDQAE